MSDNFVAFDAAHFLKDEETRQSYLEEAFNEGTEEAIMDALADIARSRGMTSLASSAGLNREHLYRILNRKSSPRLDTFLKLTQALGYKLSLEPMHAQVM